MTSRRDLVALMVARDALELAAARELLTGAAIYHSLRLPFGGLETVYGGGMDAPATIYVDRGELARARAVLAEAWGDAPEMPESGHA